MYAGHTQALRKPVITAPNPTDACIQYTNDPIKPTKYRAPLVP